MTTTTTSVAARSDLRARFHDVRAFTERLAQPLSAEDQTVQTMPDVSPTKWHRAHTTWFFETFVLGPHAAGYEAVDPAYGFLFNSYYEGVGPRHARPQRGSSPGRASPRSPTTGGRSTTPWTASSRGDIARRHRRRWSSWAPTTSSSTRSCC